MTIPGLSGAPDPRTRPSFVRLVACPKEKSSLLEKAGFVVRVMHDYLPGSAIKIGRFDMPVLPGQVLMPNEHFPQDHGVPRLYSKAMLTFLTVGLYGEKALEGLLELARCVQHLDGTILVEDMCQVLRPGVLPETILHSGNSQLVYYVAEKLHQTGPGGVLKASCQPFSNEIVEQLIKEGYKFRVAYQSALLLDGCESCDKFLRYLISADDQPGARNNIARVLAEFPAKSGGMLIYRSDDLLTLPNRIACAKAAPDHCEVPPSSWSFRVDFYK